MARLTQEIKDAISKQDFFPLATSSPDSVPNVVYVKYLKVLDDQTVLIGDNYFEKTKKNLEDNKYAAFVVLDEKKGSFQIKGRTKRLLNGPLYDEVQNWVEKNHPRAAAVVIDVEEIFNGAKRI